MNLFRVKRVNCYSGDQEKLLMISQVLYLLKRKEAVLKIMEYIDLPFPQLAILLQFVPLFIRDFVYDNVANNRYQIFGRSESCEI
ncbi:hypothetical protein GLYMA_15G009100v4 [Glycine max]|nr:hypothetical protein GLYMA_15G009100v4 [Glycine max]KAH1144888.1 hypothetical protein GYH30_040963 [Glycine max]